MGRHADLDGFYRLMDRLANRVGGARLLADPGARLGLPPRGVYFFFEPGEFRADGKKPRVVRVGTHAVSEGSTSILWGRLAQHRGRVDSEGGNHRGSIFRHHLGAALANRGMADVAAAALWEQSRRPPAGHMREMERYLEQLVSRYIRAMPFLWIDVNDPPGKASHRKVSEANAIGLLSNLKHDEVVDPPSDHWLGRWSSRSAIRESGLWNVDHAHDGYNPEFLDLVGHYIEAASNRGWRE